MTGMGSQLGTLEPLRLSTPTTTRRPSAFLPVPISRVTLPSHRPVPTQSSRRPTQLHSVPLIFAADLFKEPASSSCSGSRVRPVQSWKFASDPADQARRAWCHRGKGSSAYSALGPLKSETGVRFAVGAPIEFAQLAIHQFCASAALCAAAASALNRSNAPLRIISRRSSRPR